MSTKQLLALVNSRVDGDGEQVLSIALLLAPYLGAIVGEFALPPARQLPPFQAFGLRV